MNVGRKLVNTRLVAAPGKHSEDGCMGSFAEGNRSILYRAMGWN